MGSYSRWRESHCGKRPRRWSFSGGLSRPSIHIACRNGESRRCEDSDSGQNRSESATEAAGSRTEIASRRRRRIRRVWQALHFRKKWKAARGFELLVGPLPSGARLLHPLFPERCVGGACCNPAHMKRQIQFSGIVPAEKRCSQGHLINSQNSVIERRGDRILVRCHIPGPSSLEGIEARFGNASSQTRTQM